MRAIPFGNDGIYSPEDYFDRINYDLANDLGHLLNRNIAMIKQYEGGILPALQPDVTPFELDLGDVAQAALAT